jgi:pyruvate dehydrogenase E1 component alpha subunit
MEEEQIYRARDPIDYFKVRVLSERLLDPEELEKIEKKATAQVEAAVKFAEQAPAPAAEECLKDVYVSYP